MLRGTPVLQHSINAIKWIFCLLSFILIRTGEASSDLKLAEHYFDEIQRVCEKDNGALWGKSLCGPILLVEPGSRRIFANQSDSEGSLKRQGEIFTGVLPDELGVANAAIEWNGVRWSMLLWPLPEDTATRIKLLMHELFHRIQVDLGFPQNLPSNAHLNSTDARTWMRFEWFALRSALKTKDDDSKNALIDALTFRAYRRSLFANAAADENALEMNEGLAEYTGVQLSGVQPERLASAALKSAHWSESYVRTFAYYSGPAYGLLLDRLDPYWKRNLKPDDDLGDLLRRAIGAGFPVATEEAALMASEKYGGNKIIAEELQRSRARDELLATFKNRLVDGPCLILPLEQMKIEFDPSTVYPLDESGTVYQVIRIKDSWGVLNASDGALIDSKFSSVRVPVPDNLLSRPIQGEKFILDLAAGWRIEPAERPGDYIASRSVHPEENIGISLESTQNTQSNNDPSSLRPFRTPR